MGFEGKGGGDSMYNVMENLSVCTKQRPEMCGAHGPVFVHARLATVTSLPRKQHEKIENPRGDDSCTTGTYQCAHGVSNTPLPR